MRLWSLHPRYLDRAGLTAVWREGLLAKKVLEGQTKGYQNHPQLQRFKDAEDTLLAINAYLHAVCDEAGNRGYTFDRTKLSTKRDCAPIVVTNAQMAYEWKHLHSKLQARAPVLHEKWIKEAVQEPHPLFVVRQGDIEPWERF